MSKKQHRTTYRLLIRDLAEMSEAAGILEKNPDLNSFLGRTRMLKRITDDPEPVPVPLTMLDVGGGTWARLLPVYDVVFGRSGVHRVSEEDPSTLRRLLPRFESSSIGTTSPNAGISVAIALAH